MVALFLPTSKYSYLLYLLWNNIIETWHCAPFFFRLDSFPLLEVYVSRCYQFVSPFSFKYWCLQSKSGFCSSNSTSNLKLYYSIFYWFYIGIIVYWNLPPCVWHPACFSQATGCSMGWCGPVVWVRPLGTGGGCCSLLVVPALWREEAGNTLSSCIHWCQLGRK